MGATKKDFDNSQAIKNVVDMDDETDVNFLDSFVPGGSSFDELCTVKHNFPFKPHLRILNIYQFLGKDTITKTEKNNLSEAQSSTSSASEPYISDWSSGG